MSKINWKLRLKNKSTLAGIASAIIICASSISQALGVSLPVDAQTATDAVTAVLAVLCALGVVVDPTTAGIADSQQAMGYSAPRDEQGSHK